MTNDYCDVRQSISKDDEDITYNLEITTTNSHEFELVKEAVDEALSWRLLTKPSADALTDDGK